MSDREPEDLDGLLDNTVGALYAVATDDEDLLHASLTAVHGHGPDGVWAATRAWAEAFHQCTGQDGRLNAVYVEGDGDMPPEGAHTVLAARVIACTGNEDGVTALTLWDAAGPEVALRASRLVLELAGGAARRQMETRR